MAGKSASPQSKTVLIGAKVPPELDRALEQFVKCLPHYKNKSDAIRYLLVDALAQYLDVIDLALKIKTEGYTIDPEKELSDEEELALSLIRVPEEDLIELEYLIKKSLIAIKREIEEEAMI